MSESDQNISNQILQELETQEEKKEVQPQQQKKKLRLKKDGKVDKRSLGSSKSNFVKARQAKDTKKKNCRVRSK